MYMCWVYVAFASYVVFCDGGWPTVTVRGLVAKHTASRSKAMVIKFTVSQTFESFSSLLLACSYREYH